jgi:cytochrome c peroxidase
MSKRILVLFFLFIAVFASFKGTQEELFSIPLNWPKPSYDFTKNPLSSSKVELGRALFYDPILSRDNSISCASCHSPYNAFAHVDHDLSHGIDNKIGTRNAPALMNLAWKRDFMWDGAINHLDMQALFPITHPKEMDEKIENVVAKLQRSKLYPSLYLEAFGDSTISGEHTLKALSQFMLTLISCNSKYDSVMQKQVVFTAQEKNGYRLFQLNCAACHTEPLFTNLNFENNGLALDTALNDYGRMLVTKNYNDSLKFKVPTLRNIEFTYPYMHDGRFKKLSEVILHYTNGIIVSPTLSSQLIKPISLNANERVDLLAFLLSLSDKSFLFDSRYSYPKKVVSK